MIYDGDFFESSELPDQSIEGWIVGMETLCKRSEFETSHIHLSLESYYSTLYSPFALPKPNGAKVFVPMFAHLFTSSCLYDENIFSDCSLGDYRRGE